MKDKDEATAYTVGHFYVKNCQLIFTVFSTCFGLDY